MPRQNRRVLAPGRPLGSAGARRTEDFRGVRYLVVTAPASDRVYRCPGCDHEIIGVPHVVTWPALDLDAGDRRHWHTPCWQARENRRPTRLPQ